MKGPAFTEWWSGYPAQLRGPDGLRELAAAAFKAGYVAAVKAHDASGCPYIFMESKP